MASERSKSMSEWNSNNTADSNKKPPQHKIVTVQLQDGTILKASWLKDVNKYVRNVNSWRIIDTGNYIKDSEVIGWKYDNDTDSTDNKKE